MTMIGAVGSIPPSPPLTMTVVNKDWLAKERWVRAINAGQGHCWIHPTAASVDNDRQQQSAPSAPSHRCLRQRQPLSTKTANAAINGNDWRHWLHPPPPSLTLTVVDKDRQRRRQQRQSALMAPSHRLLCRGQPASTKTGLQMNAGSVSSTRAKPGVLVSWWAR